MLFKECPCRTSWCTTWTKLHRNASELSYNLRNDSQFTSTWWCYLQRRESVLRQDNQKCEIPSRTTPSTTQEDSQASLPNISLNLIHHKAQTRARCQHTQTQTAFSSIRSRTRCMRCPARWGFFFDALIKVYKNLGTDAIIQASISELSTNLKIAAFVDDTALLCIISRHLSNELQTLLQSDAQLWEKVLYTSGG
jgi:hypothetical protein